MTTLATDLYLLVAAYGLAIAVSYAGLPVLGQGAFVAVGAFGTTQERGAHGYQGGREEVGGNRFHGSPHSGFEISTGKSIQ